MTQIISRLRYTEAAGLTLAFASALNRASLAIDIADLICSLFLSPNKTVSQSFCLVSRRIIMDLSNQSH